MGKIEAVPSQLKMLIEMCKSELDAEEVWLFGSRARGDNTEYSDWDLLAILPDDAPEEALDPVNLWQIRRNSGLHADLFGVRRSEFTESLDSVTTLSWIVHREGVRVDCEKYTAP